MTMHPSLLAAALVCTLPASAAATREDLRASLQARFAGDRTRVNLVAALVGEDGTVFASFAADPREDRNLGPRTPFEIGGAARTLAAVLAEDAILRGTLTLDTPLSRFLPQGTRVPDFEGKPITLAHLLAQRSGLAAFPGAGKEPAPGLAPTQVLAALGQEKLEAEPGTHLQASPFAGMLLSMGLAGKAGTDYPTLLRDRLFGPLGMEDACVCASAPGQAAGHGPSGRPSPNWTFAPDLAGAGGVKASATDLARLVATALGLRPGQAAPAVQRTLEPLGDAVPRMTAGWAVISTGAKRYLVSEGTDPGTTCLLIVAPEQRQGLVLLADTSLATVGGLVPLGLSILDPAVPSPGFPRRQADPGASLKDGLAGTFRTQDGDLMTIEKRDGKLFARKGSGPTQELAFDTAGEFFSLSSDLLLRPVRTETGLDLQIRDLGGPMRGERLPAGAPVLTPDELKVYEGDYKMATGFTVQVVARLARLVVLGMDIGEVPLRPVKKDAFVAETSKATYGFERDKKGKLVRLVVRTGGETLKAVRQ
jgi:serine-type D-Ala-D-Ala carboxypeptidase/endopeptidase